MALHKYNTTIKYSTFEKKVCSTFFSKPFDSLTNLFINIKKFANFNKTKEIKILVSKTTYEVVHIVGEDVETISKIMEKYKGILRFDFVKFTDNSPVSILDYEYLFDLNFHYLQIKNYGDIIQFCEDNDILLVKPTSNSINLFALVSDHSKMAKLKLKLTDCIMYNLNELLLVKSILDSKLNGLQN